ncbi:MAG: hypothetical protein AVDCRST_MAG47-28 [uncultured Nocardioidaceae bacterium]|uniref:Uncharacterized protein n=1 Tax=uncultured Nocardioidaceae bacterium TaxID=253824 RepID=A0A6J4MI75_9ACTN|nr:MAG: hypothetical protein AVDCRST_MAG47-28 [uncultured Nocardioidaceae bacterium]
MGSEESIRGSTEMHQALFEAIDQHVARDHVRVDGHATCPCGQELDTCRRAHCPRCGHRLPTTRTHVA